MRTAFRTLLLAAPLLGLACGRGGLSARELQELRGRIAACPVPLTDAALDDVETYARCGLTAPVARLVRNDYADDALEAPDLDAVRRRALDVPRSAFEAQLCRFVDPRGVLAGFIEVDAARGVLRPDPVLAPGVEASFAPEPRGARPEACGDACAGRLLPPLFPERPYRAARRDALRAAAGPGHPLAGLRVVIDPGHSGGPYAPLDERRVTYAAPGAPAVAVQEGDLALRTAQELSAKLWPRGAEPILTRTAPGLVHPFPLHALRPYADQLLRRIALDPAYARVEAALAPPEKLRLHAALAVWAVKKQSRAESLRWRARKAVNAGADLVLSIHFNAAAPDGKHRGEEVLAMIRGFLDADRLYNPAYRADALRAALDVDDFDAAAHLGAACVRAMSDRLGLPAAGEPRYPDHLAIRDARGRPLGVDAWDGALLRGLDLPAVLTEGPYVDDPRELPRLAADLATPVGTPGTRTERYADALAACVEEFATRWIASERNPFGPFE